MNLFSTCGTNTIEQGRVGNCSLLTVLDCLMNTSTEGLNFIKSMFHKTEDGVVLRIKRTYHSENLKNKNLTQYRYFYDNSTDEDVFFVSLEKCEQIAGETKGVKTNALAIKILERICSYYFYNNWQSVTNSIEAHNFGIIRYAHKTQFGTLSFIAEWLSLDIKPIKFEDFWMIRQLLSNLPVYLSFELYPGLRHAFRLETIEKHPKYSTDWSVFLRNPWHNMKRERYSLSQVLCSASSFYLVKSNSLHYELACALLKNKTVLKVWFGESYTLLKESTADPKIFDAYYPKLQTLIHSFGDTLVHFIQQDGLSEQHMQTMRRLHQNYTKGLDHWVSVKLSPKKFQSDSSAFTVWKRPSIHHPIILKSEQITEQATASYN